MPLEPATLGRIVIIGLPAIDLMWDARPAQLAVREVKASSVVDGLV